MKNGGKALPRKLFVAKDHRPAIVKRAVIGSKGGWKLCTIFKSCKVFHEWSIILLREIYYIYKMFISLL